MLLLHTCKTTISCKHITHLLCQFIHWWSQLLFLVKAYGVYVINKRIHGCMKKCDFSSRVPPNMSFGRYQVEHEQRISISSCTHVFFSYLLYLLTGPYFTLQCTKLTFANCIETYVMHTLLSGHKSMQKNLIHHL